MDTGGRHAAKHEHEGRARSTRSGAADHQARRPQALRELVPDLLQDAARQGERAAVQRCCRHLLHRQPHCAPQPAQPLQQLARLSRPAGSGMFPSHTPASQLACSHQPLSFSTALVTLAFSGLSGRRVRTTKPPCCSTLGLYARCCVGSCGNGEQARPAEVAHALQRRAARGACAAAPPPQGLHFPSREPSAHAPALPPP